jgi:hypothetical protein
LNKGNNQGVLTWEMHGEPSTTSIVVLMWISKTHATTTFDKLQKYNLLNITEFSFGANSFIRQNKRIYDCQTPINLIKKIRC